MHTIMRRFLPHFSAVESDKRKKGRLLCAGKGGRVLRATRTVMTGRPRLGSGLVAGGAAFFSQTLFNFFFFFQAFFRSYRTWPTTTSKVALSAP